jgi:tetratricopeptide (TPR) repeat protein
MMFARRAVELAPDRADSHIALATALRRARRRAESAAAYRRAYELSPNDVGAAAGLGWVYIGEGRFDEALRWRMRAVTLDPTTGSRHRQVGIAYAMLGEYDEAERWFAQAVRLSPEVWFFHDDLARSHVRKGDAAAARARLTVMLSVAPGQANAWESAGRNELALGDTAAAIRHFKRILTDHPAALPPLALGLIHWRRGERETAESIFRAHERDALASLDNDDEETDAPYRLAVIHGLRGDSDAAVRWLEQMVRQGIGMRLLRAQALPDVLMADARVQRILADLVAERERQRQRVLREGWQ